MSGFKTIRAFALLGGMSLIFSGCAGEGNNNNTFSSMTNISSMSAVNSSMSSSVISSSSDSSSISSSNSSSINSSVSSSDSSSSSSSVSSNLSSSISSSLSSNSSSTSPDITPADINFTSQNNVELNTSVLSNSVTISEIDSEIPISIVGGEYSINNGAFTNAAGTIANGQQLTLRVLSSANEATQSIATLTLSGTINKKFTITTKSVPLKIVKLEAENFTVIGNSMAVFENNASANNVLSNISQQGNGFQFVATQKTEKLQFAYRATADLILSVSFNDIPQDNISISSTGAQTYSTFEMNVKLEKGQAISFAFVSGGDLTLDFVKLVPSPFQVVSTLAKAAAFNGDGLTIDQQGNIFVGTSKGASVKRVTPSGEISLFATFAGGSSNGSDFDSKGNLYVANESGNIVHKITPDGTVSDFAINLDGPAGIFVDENDDLIVGLYGALSTSPGAKVIKIAPDQTITTLASGGGLTNVVGVAGDGKGRYFAANFKTGEIFEITNGNVKQIGTAATRVNHIKYAGGYLYMPNPLDNVVRRMDLSGNIELVAGAKFGANSLDGSRLLATFSRPNSVDISPDGKTLFILDFNTGDVRTIQQGDSGE